MNARVWSATNASRSDVAQKLHDVAVSQNLHSAPEYINLFKKLGKLTFEFYDGNQNPSQRKMDGN